MFNFTMSEAQARNLHKVVDSHCQQNIVVQER